MMELDRRVAQESRSNSEEQVERALRPRQLAEYVGQEKARGQL